MIRVNTHKVAGQKATVETGETAFAGLAAFFSTWLLLKTGVDIDPEMLMIIGTLAYKFVFKYVRDLLKRRLA